MKLGQRITSMRGYRLLTQEALGDLVGVTKQTISGWERGRRSPSADDLIKLCQVLNCSADYLLGMTDEMGERR